MDAAAEIALLLLIIQGRPFPTMLQNHSILFQSSLSPRCSPVCLIWNVVIVNIYWTALEYPASHGEREPGPQANTKELSLWKTSCAMWGSLTSAGLAAPHQPWPRQGCLQESERSSSLHVVSTNTSQIGITKSWPSAGTRDSQWVFCPEILNPKTLKSKQVGVKCW